MEGRGGDLTSQSIEVILVAMVEMLILLHDLLLELVDLTNFLLVVFVIDLVTLDPEESPLHVLLNRREWDDKSIADVLDWEVLLEELIQLRLLVIREWLDHLPPRGLAIPILALAPTCLVRV